MHVRTPCARINLKKLFWRKPCLESSHSSFVYKLVTIATLEIRTLHVIEKGIIRGQENRESVVTNTLYTCPENGIVEKQHVVENLTQTNEIIGISREGPIRCYPEGRHHFVPIHTIRVHENVVFAELDRAKAAKVVDAIPISRPANHMTIVDCSLRFLYEDVNLWYVRQL